MPYIDKERRTELDMAADVPETPGELNYAITTLCLDYLEGGDKDYAALNEIVGALECAKLEFYRRAVSPYEDQKKSDNGDVYA